MVCSLRGRPGGYRSTDQTRRGDIAGRGLGLGGGQAAQAGFQIRVASGDDGFEGQQAGLQIAPCRLERGDLSGAGETIELTHFFSMSLAQVGSDQRRRHPEHRQDAYDRNELVHDRQITRNPESGRAR
jgi:hypothetical protein